MSRLAALLDYLRRAVAVRRERSTAVRFGPIAALKVWGPLMLAWFAGAAFHAACSAARARRAAPAPPTMYRAELRANAAARRTAAAAIDSGQAADSALYHPAADAARLVPGGVLLPIQRFRPGRGSLAKLRLQHGRLHHRSADLLRDRGGRMRATHGLRSEPDSIYELRAALRAAGALVSGEDYQRAADRGSESGVRHAAAVAPVSHDSALLWTAVWRRAPRRRDRPGPHVTAASRARPGVGYSASCLGGSHDHAA